MKILDILVGEEFIIIFSKTLMDEAFEVAEKIRTSVSNMNIIDNERITINNLINSIIPIKKG